GRRCFAVVGVHHELDERIQFDRVEPVACGVADDGDAVLQPGRVEVGEGDFGRGTVVADAREPGDVGDTAGQPQHPRPVAPYEQGNRTAWRGDQFAGRGAHTVMGAVDVDGRTGKQWADHVDGLDEPVDPRRTLVESDACRVVLGLHVARAESQFESAAGDRG